MKPICLVFATALLAGCGGGGSGAVPPMSGSGQPPVVPPPGDAFTSALAALVRTTPDSGEPADVDGTVPPMPDGTEPAAVE